jgi:hypothetical protein
MKTRKNFKKERCAPSKTRKVTGSCLSVHGLSKLKAAFNTSRRKKIRENSPTKIWHALKNELKHCKNESCWVKRLNVTNSELKDYTFAPKKPNSWKKKKNSWLSNFDILKVMTQYEHAFPEFKFLGPSPIDFDKKLSKTQCVWKELCSFKIKQYLKKGKKYLGIVFNLDTHDKSGSHWVAGFIDVPKKKFYYFDSTGEPTPKEVVKLVNRVKEQFKEEGIDMKFQENHVEHQQGTTECGMYVLYFIAYMIVYNDFSKFNKDSKPVTDKRVESLRNQMFN